MPVLWQPNAVTTTAAYSPSLRAQYTLLIMTTEWIDRGIILRFVVWNGVAYTYCDAYENSAVARFDLTVIEPIPPGTVVVVSMTPTGTALYGYTGSKAYATGGASVPVSMFVPWNSCLCFAYAPTAIPGQTIPANGQPMFAIGFNYPTVSLSNPQMGTSTVDGTQSVPCGLPLPSGAYTTAPNFPDQYSAVALPTVRWTFEYEVVYPAYVVFESFEVAVEPERTCTQVVGIKFRGTITAYPVGSWSNARDVIAQPWTIVKNNYLSVSNWQTYDVTSDPSPDVGPFSLSAMPGQLVPVYFRPAYKNINTDDATIDPASPLSGGPAALGVVVTSPLQPNMSLNFTWEEFDVLNGGFGPRNSSTDTAIFLTNDPSFVWNTGYYGIPAGTVIYFGNLGGGAITVRNAHDPDANVGSISYQSLASPPIAVTSIICTGLWLSFGTGSSRPITAGNFVCAALSDQYAGDFPPLSPCLTIAKDRFIGQVIYGYRRIINNRGLPGTVQAPMINAASFTQLDWDVIIDPNDLPVFTNMGDWAW